MVEQKPREYLTRVLELSHEMVRLAQLDPGHEMDLGCRTVFGALLDYGYTLKKMAEKELAAHLPRATEPVEPVRVRARRRRRSTGKLPKVDREPGEGRRILCVDDSPAFISFLEVLLEDNGYQAISANDGREALQKIEENDIDLIILDVMMPKKTGFVLFKELKRADEYRDIPILMLTGVAASLTELDAQSEDTVARPYDSLREQLRTAIQEMRETGDVRPEMFVDKPVDPGALIATVRALVGE
jgi:CheY-like chemotaxis protein